MQKLPINNFEEVLYYDKLPNGLDLYLLPLANKKNYFAFLGTRYGGKDINFKIADQEYHVPTGIAHFLEHKLFEQEENPFAYYSKSGTDVNAQTTSDYTAYYFTGNQNFLNNLKYLLNWVTVFNIDDTKVKKEQGIILEEARMYKDNPARILYEKIKENTFITDPVRYKVIGTDEDIKKITKEDLELCYRAFYRPDNMFLIIVGNFPLDETYNLIKEELKDFKNPKEKVSKITVKEPDNVLKKQEVIVLNKEVPRIGYSIKINQERFKKLNLEESILDHYLFMIIALSLGSASDFREYLLSNHLFLSLSHQITKTDTHYVLEFYATSNEPEKLGKELTEYLKNIVLKKDDFVRIKKTWIASEVRIMDSLQACLYNILDDILDYKEFKNQRINDIKTMDFATLNKVLKCCDFQNCCEIIIK